MGFYENEAKFNIEIYHFPYNFIYKCQILITLHVFLRLGYKRPACFEENKISTFTSLHKRL